MNADLDDPGPAVVARPDAAAADALRGAWLRVAALLAHVAEECAAGGAGTRAAFAALDDATAAHARRQALLQRAHLLGAACRAGAPLRDADLADAAAALAPRDDIVDDYVALARAFDTAAQVTRRHGRDPALVGWLRERARLHRAHAALLGTGFPTAGPDEPSGTDA